jgi:hypothetical protein
MALLGDSLGIGYKKSSLHQHRSHQRTREQAAAGSFFDTDNLMGLQGDEMTYPTATKSKQPNELAQRQRTTLF